MDLRPFEEAKWRREYCIPIVSLGRGSDKYLHFPIFQVVCLRFAAKDLPSGGMIGYVFESSLPK